MHNFQVTYGTAVLPCVLLNTHSSAKGKGIVCDVYAEDEKQFIWNSIIQFIIIMFNEMPFHRT